MSVISNQAIRLNTAETAVNADTFLPPIENPRSLIMKVLYALMRRQFGTVITPIKVFSVRMPLAFGQWYSKSYSLDKKLTLPEETVTLVRQQVSRINVCEFCMDAKRFYAIQTSMNMAKFDALGYYRTSPLFSEKERALLDYVTELTTDKKVNKATFDRLAAHYSEGEICEVVFLVASEHLSNISNAGLNIHSDMLCNISSKKR